MIEEKLLFDTDLKIELQKNPESYTLQTIQKVIQDVFGYKVTEDVCLQSPQRETEYQSTPNTPTHDIDEDFDLTIHATADIDLVQYVQTMQLTNDHLSQKLHKEYSYVPSFSLGIENDIIQQVCEDINQQEIEGTPNSQDQTPELPKRLKSTRNIKMGRYAKSPYIQRGIDITAKCTNEDLGLWRFLIQNKDPL